jgi:hypothetical protein
MMMQRRSCKPFRFTLLVVLLSGLAAGATFAALQTEVQVLQSDPDRTVLEVRLGDLEMLPIVADGKNCVLPALEGEPSLMDRGAPELPVVRQALIIGDLANATVRVLDADYESIKTDPIVPSKGHLLRSQDPKDVPFEFGPVYKSSGLYPAEQAILHEPFILRDFRGVVVELRPVRYDPDRGQIQVARRMVVEVVAAPGQAKNPLYRRVPLSGVDAAFAPIYANVFGNWPPASYRYNPIPESGRCLILTADIFYDQVVPLYQWELQKGVPTILKKLSEVGTTATQIKNYIQSLYNEPAKITYVILVGDSAQMPYLRGTAESAPSDPMYVKLAGTDSYPDAFVSRISAQNANQVETQVARSIRYEKTPDLGAAGDWYHKACGVASNAYGGGAYDWQRANWLRDTLLGYTYTEVDQIYDPTATKAMITNAINNGRGFVNYIGHGATTYWVTTGFNVQDVYNLSNGFKNPYICDVACVNGDFTYGECFAEAWIRAGTAAAPKGAIGVYAPTTNASWVPPCDMQTEVVRLLTQEIKNTLGGLSFNGVCKAMDLWPGNEGTKLMEQYHVFGDCTLMMRTTNPGALTVEHAPILFVGQGSFAVTTPGVSGARAALYANGHLYGVAYTDANGAGSIPVDPLPPSGAALTLTVTAYNKETVIETVPVAPSSNAIVQISGSTFDPEDVVAGAATNLTLELNNSGTDTAHTVAAVLRPIGGSSTVQDSTAAFGDIAGGQSLWGLDAFTFTPDPSLPDSALIDLAVEIRSTDYVTWFDTLSVRVLAPVFAYKDAIIDDNFGDEDGRMDHGEQSLVTIGIRNTGSADASDIEAVLSSSDPGVNISQSVSALATLRAGEAGYFQGTFVVEVLPTVSEGDITFFLQLSAARGRQQELEFTLPVGGYLETAEYAAPFCSHCADSSFVDEWHITGTANITPGGTHSWKCGAVGEGGYAPLNDSRLIATPLLQVGGQGRLSFWHKMSAEIDSSQAGIAFDGGMIEISTDSLTFVPLVPAGGYPYTIRDRANGGPFAEGTPCYSGTFDWTKVEIDLSAYGGTVQIRFRFGSDAEGTAQGWWIDDVEVRGLDVTADAPDLAGRSDGLVLGSAQPNPFNAKTGIGVQIPASGRVRLQIVDATGRLIRTLLDETCPAGERFVTWDGRSDAGRELPSGVYYARLDQAGRTKTGRLVMLK